MFQKWASICAADASENHFESRRGIYPMTLWDSVSFGGVLCIYNNNPYSAGSHFREEETARIRAWLHEQKIEELGYATYPPDGEEAGYTYAMLIRADQDKQDAIKRELEKITCETFRRIRA